MSFLVKRGSEVDVDALLRNVPGGITYLSTLTASAMDYLPVAYPTKPRVFQRSSPCDGCGAAVALYAYRCDYCRRVR